MLAAEMVSARKEREWTGNGLFTAEKLLRAAEELILVNTDIQPAPVTCNGRPMASKIQAPNHRPDPRTDTHASLFSKLYPTMEEIKLCADAKHFFAIACGAGSCDQGLARAIAESGNDILIGGYCEAADDKTLSQLQQVDWQLSSLGAGIIQFRALGYYRDHARRRLPEGIYGSRMTGYIVHRHIDIAIFNGVLPASLATGEELDESRYNLLSEACSLINDLIGLRSDTMRKTRENIVLRGVRGNICEYLSTLLSHCLQLTCEVISSGKLGAIVVMSFCNWVVMASHHKLSELVTQTRQVLQRPACKYALESDTSSYRKLLATLAPYGSGVRTMVPASSRSGRRWIDYTTPIRLRLLGTV
ncbi:hypothetical protein AJ79_10163 [Helicocarpus griseus UAMH5409]|uniref:Uncharacterized protein n=1 Tax=Helicocarpus griseus UAMH5409 TaxID=1447875 RepID=A0A2B7WF78_9EURO|nr:hypothetical protein AJ79_10163 [Helicocarpus griseus UAMH5409]